MQCKVQMNHVMSGAPWRVLYENVEVDEDGLNMLLVYCELVNADAARSEDNGAFVITIQDEISCCKDYVEALEQATYNDDPEKEFPLTLETTDLFLPWMPVNALAQWGFVTCAFCRHSHVKTAQRLRDSCRQFGIPYTFQETSAVHASTSPKASTDLRYSKPNFIFKMLDKHSLPMLCLDCDLIVMAEPVHITELLKNGADWGTTNLLAD